jgi:hypothetical protein
MIDRSAVVIDDVMEPAEGRKYAEAKQKEKKKRG